MEPFEDMNSVSALMSQASELSMSASAQKADEEDIKKKDPLKYYNLKL